MTGYRGRRYRKTGRLWSALFSLMTGCFFLLVCLWGSGHFNLLLSDNAEQQDISKDVTDGNADLETTVSDNFISDDVLSDDTFMEEPVWEVHCIDVGQASATLIISGEYVMLADTGNKEDANLILNYLAEQEVTELDYLLLTHPHEDHIGAAARILREIPVDRVLMPEIGIDMCETVCYAELLSAIEEKEPITDYPKAGDVYSLGEMSFTVVCPNPEWQPVKEDINESSLGVHISDGERSILLYGDGKQYCEAYMTEQQEIAADILIVGHHGSSYSSSAAFLEAVNPKYAVISCGKDNDYGFPHGAVLDRLAVVGAEVFRTDELGTIVFLCDGKNITF